MSRDFTAEEQILLRFLTAGEGPIATLARVQVDAAKFLDYWGLGDQSFEIEPAQGVPPLPTGDGIYEPSDKYFTLASDEQGGLMLWVKSGLITSLEVYWYGDQIPRLPLPDEVADTPNLR
ncbi:hypothetical protein [Leifsonia shinshuensis]|uniref:Uncharacterized protein n=1 Tax=Leifsonia shinshuensis TaxID=150026 RepID=A0A853CWM9_9MICO|nr:hypothetical protein [Leifsonia shinshuensis]NYJ24878.1 hypothetical protein [Leifsonia shinshuensis]